MIAKVPHLAMSYREIRVFTEMLRTLGYHRIVAIGNFRRPNFELVADITEWLMHREGGLKSKH